MTLLIKIITNVILIPKIGYLAACWATIISDFCHYWIGMLLLKKIGFPINSAKLIGTPALGGILSALCFLPIQWYHSIVSTVFFTGLAVVAYASVIYISKYMRKVDFLLLIHPTKRM
jgi:O-antigen/teichoic acid export membrane protein